MARRNRYLPILFAFLLMLAASSCWLTSLVRASHISSLRKLDPVLKALILRAESARPAPSQYASFPVALRHDPHVLNTMIKITGNPMAIKAAGARVRSITGSIVTADVPFHTLDGLIALPNVIYIQSARQMRSTMLDASVPDTRADQVRASVPGYTGKGVIVGVIDGGIDWAHPDFQGSDGGSRILYIWDQTVQTPALYPTYGYGTEWTKDHIDSGQCQEMDATGHGTHTASTMAGNGGDRHGFTGVAPEANIIAVKTTFQDADIIDAADYIFQKAEELGRPAVINMSFGSHDGAHDGTSMTDQAMDELLNRPGRVIVASAGNDGGSSIHVGTASLRQPVNENYPWTAVVPSLGAQLILVQIWYPATEILSVRFLAPGNDAGDMDDQGVGWVSTGQFRHFSVTNGPLMGAEIIVDADDLASELMHPDFNGVYILISNDGDLTIPIDEYIYGIEFDGAGVEIDAYALWNGTFINNVAPKASFPSEAFLLEGNGNKTIISPSSASRVICVGSYTTKSEWVDSQNRIRAADYLNVGALSAFSSRGPLLNGARKPEIAAPGEMVVAAFSADGWIRPRNIHQDREHAAWAGTSMSSPHVAGAAALIYEKYPHLTSSEIKDMLTSTAVDAGPAGWDKSWGYGKLDVLVALGIPSAPLGLRATADDGSVTVTWSRNRESDIAGYNLDVGYWTSDTEFQRQVFDIKHPVSSYQIADLPNDVKVTLSLRAYDVEGNESARSQEITIIPNAAAPDITPPEPPQNLEILPINSAADLTWSSSSEHDLSGYRVYYGTSAGNYTKNIWVGKKTEYRLKNLANGVRIYVVISAKDVSGNESDKSREVSGAPTLRSRVEQRLQGGWPFTVQHDVHSSPTLFDVDGDGKTEVAVSAKDGNVYLLSHDGDPMAGWPVSTDSASVSSPAVGDVDGDGRVEVVAGAGEMMYMWRDDGSLMDGWPAQMDGSALASPAMGDIDGDGEMEVVAGSWGGRIYAYNTDASPVDGWPVETQGRVSSSAAIGDVDGDSRMEIVVGSEYGDVYVFNDDGTIADSWPAQVGSAVSSSPALGDVDGDGNLEIVAADEGGRVHAWRHDGQQMEGWPVDLRDSISSSPALGDMDGDRKTLEVVISTRHGSVYVLKSDGATMDGWPVSVIDIITSAPALGDVNSDGSPDVIVATGTGGGHVGLVYAFRNTGKSLGSKWPVFVEGNIEYSSPALGDLEGDGDVELVVGSSRQSDGSGGNIYAWDLTGRLTDESILWGGFRHDPLHTGVADDKLPPSFVIAALQNTVLKKYVHIYVIPSERLAAPPVLAMEIGSGDPDDEVPTQFLSLAPLDATSRVYQAEVTVELDGRYTFTATGTDASGNEGSSWKTIPIQLREQISDSPPDSPVTFSLLPNYPNPFNPGTWIPYELPQPEDVTIDIYNIAGQLVRSLDLGHRDAGSYIGMESAAHWDGTNDSAQAAASGTYFYVLRAGGFKAGRKMILWR